MQKRQFLSASAGALGATLLSPSIANAAKASNIQPSVLTVTGAIERTNRPAFTPALDILMGKHKLSFEKAYTFDVASLAKLPSVSIKPVLEYDNLPHQLTGPRLTEVLQIVGIDKNASGERFKITLRAIDGYVATFSLAQVRKFEVMLAMQLDGHPMALGGLGPLWGVFNGEKQPELASLPVNQRFAQCPWAVYHIDVSVAA